MTDTIERTAEKESEFLDFELGRVADCLFEAGRQSSHDSMLFLVLLASTSLLAFPEDPSKEVTVPAFGFNLKMAYAAEALIVLTCAALYRLLASRHMEKLLGCKVRKLIEQRGRPNLNPWYLYYPSLSNFHGHMFDSTSHRIRGLSYGFGFLYFVFGFLCVVVLLIRLGFVYTVSPHWFVAAVLTAALLTASLILLADLPKPNVARETVMRMEAYPADGDDKVQELPDACAAPEEKQERHAEEGDTAHNAAPAPDGWRRR